MTYQVLARKWRPQDFSSVIGQEPIVTALRNALTERRIAQAYLFSGIRGVGKTSVARILAKALNCEQGPAADPCNECLPCREITEGSDFDVREVDAATYSKVEQVRDLTDSLKYGPAKNRYKVVVIDEIHRLSRQAFDALLKIVEEPPPHLVFVFATTEVESVPATILSRCQEYRFRRVNSRKLAAHLREIGDAEKIEVSDAALRLIARAGDGSVRDAVALMDQLATFGSGKIPDGEAARVLGGVDHALFQRLLGSILDGKAATVAAIAADVEQQGWDPRHVFTEFLGYCRDALHLALGGALSEVDLPEEEAGALAKLAKKASYENLLRLLNQLLGSEATVRRSESGALALEIAWLRAAELPKLVRIEELLAGASGSAAGEPSAPAGGGEEASGPETSGGREPSLFQPAARPAPAGLSALPADSSDPPSVAVAGPGPDNGAGADSASSAEGPRPAGGEEIVAFLDEVGRRKQSLAAHLREAVRLEFREGRLWIHAPLGDDWLNGRTLRRESNRNALRDALQSVWGDGARWKLVESAETRPAAMPAAAGEAAPDPVLEDPRVQAVLDIFGGRVESIEEQ